MTTRGIRNNNPLNIRHSAVQFHGEVQGTDPDFKTFQNAFSGIRAGAVILLTYQHIHGLHTIPEIVYRWAPPSENNTVAYVAAVISRGKFSYKDDLDMYSVGEQCRLVGAMIWQENGMDPYAPTDLVMAVTSAMENFLKKKESAT